MVGWPGECVGDREDCSIVSNLLPPEARPLAKALRPRPEFHSRCWPRSRAFCLTNLQSAKRPAGPSKGETSTLDPTAPLSVSVEKAIHGSGVRHRRYLMSRFGFSRPSAIPAGVTHPLQDARTTQCAVPNTTALHGPCPRTRAADGPRRQYPKTLRVFGYWRSPHPAAAEFFHSLLGVLLAGGRRVASALQPQPLGPDLSERHSLR